MKYLKEPLPRLANRQDKVRGAFFEERFKSVAILHQESLLATCAYIDLNAVAAGIVEVLEASPHTSVAACAEHVAEQGRTRDLEAAKRGSVAGPVVAAGLEESIWLCPIEDRRRLDSAREGMLEGFSLGSCLCLVKYTGWLFRDGPPRRKSPESPSGSAAAWRGGVPGWTRSGRAACGAAFSPPAASGCARSRPASGCITSRIWAGARRGNAG